MGGYSVEAEAEFIAAMPGPCQAGRTMRCDDPETFGWDRIGEIIRRDGVCDFRLVNAHDIEEVRSKFRAEDVGSIPGMSSWQIAKRHSQRPRNSHNSRSLRNILYGGHQLIRMATRYISFPRSG